MFQFVSNPQAAVANGLSAAPPADPRGAEPLVTAPYALAWRPAGTVPALLGNEAQPLSRLRNAVRVE